MGLPLILHNAAGPGKQGFVHHPDDHIAARIGIADLLDADMVGTGRFPGDGSQDLCIPVSTSCANATGMVCPEKPVRVVP